MDRVGDSAWAAVSRNAPVQHEPTPLPAVEENGRTGPKTRTVVYERKEATMTQPDEDRLLVDDPTDRDQEAPEADAAEQAQPANPSDAPIPPRAPAFEVNEYDAVEQDKIVDLSDDY
jgi:hypothetical protein